MTEKGRINVQGTKSGSEQEAQLSLYGKERGRDSSQIAQGLELTRQRRAYEQREGGDRHITAAPRKKKKKKKRFPSYREKGKWKRFQ